MRRARRAVSLDAATVQCHASGYMQIGAFWRATRSGLQGVIRLEFGGRTVLLIVFDPCPWDRKDLRDYELGGVAEVIRPGAAVVVAECGGRCDRR